MKNKKIIVGISVLLLILFTGCKLPTSIPETNEQAPPPDLNGAEAEDEIPVDPHPEEVPEISWRSYTDPQEIFSLEMPRDFLVNFETQEGPVSEVNLGGPEPCSPEEAYCFSRMINVKCLINQGGLTAEDWFSEAGRDYEITGHQEIAGQNAIVSLPRETEGFATRYVFTAGPLLPNGTHKYIFDLLIYSGIEEAGREHFLNHFTLLEE